jgi:hypothetical protein
MLILCHVFTIDVNLPGAATQFTASLRKILTFDYLWIKGKMDSRVGEVGYRHINPEDNLSSLTIYLCLLPILACIRIKGRPILPMKIFLGFLSSM